MYINAKSLRSLIVFIFFHELNHSVLDFFKQAVYIWYHSSPPFSSSGLSTTLPMTSHSIMS